MVTFETITPSAFSCVTTSDFKIFARINTTAEDTFIAEWISAASETWTTRTGEVLEQRTLRINWDDYPTSNILYIPRYPISSITSVQYLDVNSTWQTLAGTTTDLTGLVARIILPSSGVTLNGTLGIPRLRCQFVCGYSAASGMSALAKNAVRLLASHWYANREAWVPDQLREVPEGFASACRLRGTGFLTTGEGF